MPEDLLERDAELDVLAARIEAARSGAGGVLLLEGSPGAGKSALMRELRSRAADAGLLVRAATGSELEGEFAFGVVRQLLEPVVRAAEPAERDRLLEGAAAMAGPVLGLGAADGASVDTSFATLHGLYWLVAALTENQPVLLAVDDAHWADEPSIRFCDFLARRAHELPLLVALGMRPGEASALLTDIADAPEAEVLRPAALSLTATRHLVDAGIGETVGDDVVASAHAATGGNPLLLRELVRTLAAWDGTPTVGVVEAALPSSVTRSVERRLRRLAEPVRAAARALAVLGEQPPPAVLAAAGIPAETLPSSLAALHAAELIEGDPPQFVHPLVRQAVVDTVAPAERTALHRAAAEALREVPDAAEQVVVHLLATPPSGLDWAVPALRESARRATAEGAPEVAVRRLARALEESRVPDPGLVLELGVAELSTGNPAGIDHIDQAAGAEDPAVSADALTMQFAVGAVRDERHVTESAQRGLDLLDNLRGPEDVRRAGELQSALMNALTLDPGILPGARRRVLDEIAERPAPATLPILCFEAAHGTATRDETVAVIRDALAAYPEMGTNGVEGGLASWVLTAATAVDAPEIATEVLEQMETGRRLTGSRVVAGFADYGRAIYLNQYGSATHAEALARAALDQFDDLPVIGWSVRAELARTLGALNRAEEGEALLREVDDTELAGRRLVGTTWRTCRAELRAVQGRWDEVVADLRIVEATLADYGWSAFVIAPVAAQLARALAATGALDEARERARAAVDAAVARGIPSHAAVARVALGHALDGSAALDAFAGAVAAGERTQNHRVRAQALLAQGTALRVAGQRTEARTVLAAAREAAHRVDALAVFERATEELAVAGGRPRRIALSGVEALTPSERRVAEHAAGGLTNREIAETLFVTRKTVEFTLGRVFTKLGIRSRTELPGALSG